jgi:two-component system, LytTR family, response regulator
MTIYTCLVVDDEPLARNLMIQYIEKIPYLQLKKAVSNPLEAIEILRGEDVDILFLDVQMPELTGISLLKIIQHKPYIILTTAYSEYAIEGYELDVMDYLLKPITFERFLKSIEKAVQRLNAITPSSIAQNIDNQGVIENPLPFIFVKDGTKLVKIRLQDIQYIEGLKDYVSIYLPDKKIVSLQRMKALENILPADKFVRIHNSYIVAINWIDAILKEKIQIGKTFLPISDTYRKAFKDLIDKYNHSKE